jgi:CRISPR-associated protein Cmr2
MSEQLFIFTFSPVQAFIAEARRAQDLFAGSKILSDLAKAALVALIKQKATAIYPPSRSETDAQKLDDIPNKMTLILPNDLSASDAGEVASKALHEAWQRLCERAKGAARQWGQYPSDPAQRIKLDATWDDIWQRQIGRVWECFWAAAPIQASYKEAYQQANRLLDAAKRPRAFLPAQEEGIKDTLSGSRSALRLKDWDARKYWTNVYDLTEKNERFNAAKLRPKGRELLDAIGCVKRFGLTHHQMPTIPSTSSVASEDFLRGIEAAHLTAALSAYAQKVERLLGRAVFPVRKEDNRPGGWAYDGDLLYLDTLTTRRLKQEYDLGIDEIALRELQRDLKQLYKAVGERPRNYFAILVMDGDAMGERVDQCNNKEEHRNFSDSLSAFAGEVGRVVQEHHGSKVYAGGDDVLALLPVSTALACANKLNELFKDKVPGCTVSAGIAIGHHTQPLDGLLSEARSAEHRAKHVPGKDALAIFANKRSGERVEVAAKWSNISTVQTFVEAFEPSVNVNAVAGQDMPKYGRSALSPRFAFDARTLANSFTPVKVPKPDECDPDRKTAEGEKENEANDAIRADLLAGYLSQLKRQLGQHLDKEQAKARGIAANQLHQKLSDWLYQRLPEPEMLANWLVVARFLAQRSDGGDE